MISDESLFAIHGLRRKAQTFACPSKEKILGLHGGRNVVTEGGPPEDAPVAGSLLLEKRL